MNVDSLVSNNRVAACIVLVAALWFVTGCRNKDNAVVVRILLPPSPSALREAVANLQYSPPTDGSGRKIVPATMETTDDAQFRKFLKDVEVYRPQIVVVPTSDDIPAALKAENTHATLPCSGVPSACVSVLTPWGRDEERRAARIVQSRIGPEARAGKQSGDVTQH
jgi:hypothetical protein